jgi:hypothetical protein
MDIIRNLYGEYPEECLQGAYEDCKHYGDNKTVVQECAVITNFCL